MEIEQLKSALNYYKSQRYYIFPIHTIIDNLCSCGEKCPKPGKHPVTRHGMIDAKIDAEELFKVNGELFPYNIGIHLGKSKLMAIDIDVSGDKQGEESLEVLKKKYCQLPDTLMVTTGSGGMHFYYKSIEDGKIRKKMKDLPHIDFLSDGHYLIAPPSVHVSGGTYQWIERPIVDFPLELYKILSKAVAQNTGNSLITNEKGKKILPEGVRNDEINRMAYKMASDGFGEVIIENAIIETFELGDFPLRELRRTVKSACSSAVPSRFFEPTLRGVAQRLAEQTKNDFVWCEDEEIFYSRKPEKWVADAQRIYVSARAMEVNSTIDSELTDDMSEDLVEAIGKLKKRFSNSRTGIAEAIDFSRVYNATMSETFDKNWDSINTPDGLINLITGKPEDRKDEYMVTKISKVEYDPDACSTLYDETCAYALGDQEDMFFEMVGSMLFDYRFDQGIYILIGPGATGKSSLIGSIVAALGDYGVIMSPQDIIKNKAMSSHDNLWRLRGARIAVMSEWPDPRTTIDTGLVKSLCGDSGIQSRKIAQAAASFNTNAALVVTTNHAPRVGDIDSGIERRLRLIGMENIIPEEKRVESVQSELCNNPIHMRAALAKAVKGAMRFYKNYSDNERKYKVPVPNKIATQQFIRDQNPLSTWFDNCIEITEDMEHKIQFHELMQHANNYLSKMGLTTLRSTKSFNDCFLSLLEPYKGKWAHAKPKNKSTYLGMSFTVEAANHEDHSRF